jgi:hypothetical protein
MDDIVIVTNDKDRFSSLERGLRAESECRIVWENSVQGACDAASGTPPRLMIVDEEVDGLSNFEIARQIVLTNALANLGVVSSLSHDDFHEAGEGLGILVQLPPWPGENDVSNLLEAIKRVSF